MFFNSFRCGLQPELKRDWLRAAIGFRNVLVHGYTAVDPAIVRDVLDQHLGDIEDFVSFIRGRLQAAK